MQEVRQVRRYRVRGRVQGVAFRAFVMRSAASIGVRGWVRNRFDGSVEVLAQGIEAELNELSQRLHQGSRWSHVDDVEEQVEDGRLDELSGFSIRPTV